MQMNDCEWMQLMQEYRCEFKQIQRMPCSPVLGLGDRPYAPQLQNWAVQRPSEMQWFLGREPVKAIECKKMQLNVK